MDGNDATKVLIAWFLYGYDRNPQLVARWFETIEPCEDITDFVDQIE